MARYALGGRPIVEDYKAIDVRDLQRKDSLRPGLSGRWNWSRNGEPTCSVDFRTEHDAVVLMYRCRLRDTTAWKDIRQRVPLTWTACALGGRRPWFCCPCGRRVAILYGFDQLFECRQCGGLVYETQSQDPTYRAIKRAHAVRERLGGDPDVFSSFPMKPPRMHWHTYHRLRARGQAADRRTIDLFAEYLRRPVRIKRR